ncbi:transcription repressor OFP13-like isoform X2 [Nymphaea colorata]|uniref:transcription repressor OFP13-like isoform X2 n=1 Tax=Nymphaea colorata TaxID=210225 RepID=UPI00129D4C42|nr:transcription repressor OFP13-like isoform X2 [Nymphaea colorata]
MGKPKLMASIRALQQTLCNFKPTSSRSSSCLCVQQSQTHSFRFAADDIYKSFNSIYLDPRSAAKEKEEAGAGNGEEERESLLLLPLRARDSSSFDSSANPCSSSADSSSDSVLDLLLSGLSSKRFFFSPCTTKSILEEAKKVHNDGCGGDGGGVGGVLEPNNGEEELAFCNDSITMSMNSDDPYWDFRASMEEMVEAHGLRDWPCLQALLQCYLKLNDKKTHRIIVCAFIDLIINILDDAGGFQKTSLLCYRGKTIGGRGWKCN